MMAVAILPPPIKLTLCMCFLLLTKECRSNPHDRRAFQYGGFQIVRHAHRQGIERDGRARFSCLEQLAQLPKRRALRCMSSVGAGIAIRPRNCSRGSAATARASAGSSSGATPPLLASPLTFTCDAHLQRRQSCAGRCADRRSAIFSAVDAVHPAEIFGDGARLVALDRSDEMPFQRQIAQRLRLCPALPARSFRRMRAVRQRRPRVPRRQEGFADRQQADVAAARPAVCAAPARCAARTACKLAGDCCHNLPE